MKNKILGLYLLFCVIDLSAMYSQVVQKSLLQRPNWKDKGLSSKLNQYFKQLSPNSILVCQKFTFNCIPVEKDVAQLSDTIKEMLNDDIHSVSIPYDIKKTKFVFDVIKECGNAATLKQDQQKKEYKILTKKLTDLSLEQLVDICNCAFFLKFEPCIIKASKQNENKKIDIFAQALLLKIEYLKDEGNTLNYKLSDIAHWGIGVESNDYKHISLEECLKKYEERFNKLPNLSILNSIDQANLKRGNKYTYERVFSRSSDVTDLSSLQKNLKAQKDIFKNKMNDFIPVCQEGSSHCVRIYKDILMLSKTIKDSLELSGSDTLPSFTIPSDIFGDDNIVEFTFDFARQCNHEVLYPSVMFGNNWPSFQKILERFSLEKLIEVSRLAFYLGFECFDIKSNEENMVGNKKINIFSEAILENLLKYKNQIDGLYKKLVSLLKDGFVKYTASYEDDFDLLAECEKQLNALSDYNILTRMNKDTLILASKKLYNQLFPSNKDNLLSLQKYLNTKKDECKSLIIKCKNKNKWFYERWFGW